MFPQSLFLFVCGFVSVRLMAYVFQIVLQILVRFEALGPNPNRNQKRWRFQSKDRVPRSQYDHHWMSLRLQKKGICGFLFHLFELLVQHLSLVQVAVFAIKACWHGFFGAQLCWKLVLLAVVVWGIVQAVDAPVLLLLCLVLRCWLAVRCLALFHALESRKPICDLLIVFVSLWFQWQVGLTLVKGG